MTKKELILKAQAEFRRAHAAREAAFTECEKALEAKEKAKDAAHGAWKAWKFSQEVREDAYLKLLETMSLPDDETDTQEGEAR